MYYYITMPKTVGYRIRHNYLGKTTICKECAEAISLNSSEYEKMNTGEYSSNPCIVCQKDITNGNGFGSRPKYPEEITILLEERFKNVGPRFGGVKPRIDNAGAEKEQIKPGITKSTPIKTKYDPVIIMLSDQNIAQKLESVLDTITQRGCIRYQKETYMDDNDDVIGYDYEIFAIQS